MGSHSCRLALKPFVECREHLWQRWVAWIRQKTQSHSRLIESNSAMEGAPSFSLQSCDGRCAIPMRCAPPLVSPAPSPIACRQQTAVDPESPLWAPDFPGHGDSPSHLISTHQTFLRAPSFCSFLPDMQFQASVEVSAMDG